MLKIENEFSTLSDLFSDFNYVLSEIHDVVKRLDYNKFNESFGFDDLLENEDLLLKRLSNLKSKLESLRNDIENHLNVLTRLLSNHVRSLTAVAAKQFNRSLIDIMMQNIQSEIEFESIQKMSDEFLSSEEAGLNGIEAAKRRLNIAIVKLNKQSNASMLTVSEARAEAWNEMKSIELTYRRM